MVAQKEMSMEIELVLRLGRNWEIRMVDWLANLLGLVRLLENETELEIGKALQRALR